MKYTKLSIAATMIALLFTACGKEKTKIENPAPTEQELITTIQLVITGSGGFNKTFAYKVENGFGSTTGGTVAIDTLALDADKNYSISVKVLNEKNSPAEDVTTEVIDENTAHLFLYQSTPANGAGAVIFANGSKDANNLPFNQTGTLTTGAAGAGQFVVTLKHQPADKNAITPDLAGGETDAEASFPVLLK